VKTARENGERRACEARALHRRGSRLRRFAPSENVRKRLFCSLIILKNFKLLQNDPDTGRIFSQPPLISFKRDKNIGNLLVRSVFQTSEQPGTFKCARIRCKTCPFIRKVKKVSGPKRSIKITDHFTCTSANVIYCITCTLCKKLYIGETGRRLGDRFREHLCDVEKDDQNASKPVARHLISLIILSNIWQSVAFPFIREARKAAKL